MPLCVDMGRRRSGIYSAHESGDRPEVNITTVLRRAIRRHFDRFFLSKLVRLSNSNSPSAFLIYWIYQRAGVHEESDHAKMPFSSNDCSMARLSHECIFATNADHQE